MPVISHALKNVLNIKYIGWNIDKRLREEKNFMTKVHIPIESMELAKVICFHNHSLV